MAAPLHPLLSRQLRKIGLDAEHAPALPLFSQLLDHVGRAYVDFDQERYLLDRSQDIASTEMNALNQALQASQAKLSSLLSLSSDWIWEQDAEGRFTIVSDQLEARTGLPPEALLGHRCEIDGPLRTPAGDLQRLQEAAAQREPFHAVTFAVTTPSGEQRHMHINGEPMFKGSRFTGYRGVGRDVTNAVVAARRIEELARFDSLTGLPNRHRFMEELGSAIARSQRYGRRFALLFIDLDRFKFVNDNLGHAAGDDLLRTIGQRLSQLLREADLLARLGGDEFVVLTEVNCEAATLSKVASRILNAIAQPMVLEGRRIEISASVGIGVYPEDGNTAPALLRAADAAMYQAKAGGKNTFEFFTAELAQRAALHFALEGDLRQALQRDQLELHYQPKVDARSGDLVGIEALLRWNHPKRGLLMPAVFIELAEESGLIVPIGRWILRAACEQMVRWQAAGLAPPRCAVNISARQLQGDCLMQDLRDALAHSGLEPRHLEVEVTESMLMSDAAQAAAVLEAIDALGVEIAIDDFGTGYSSLAYLKRFPVRSLKIDRSFVRDLPGDEDDLAITRAVVAMGHSLGMTIVAEGVETLEQRDCLVQVGCDVLQGYLFSRPASSGAIEQWLQLAAQSSRQAAAVGPAGHPPESH